MKLTRRKGFNFYRSYYDVFNKLPTDKDKLEFISILLDKQFLDADPNNCSMIVEFAYESQLHSITKQVKGWKDATNLEITDPVSTPQGVAIPIPVVGMSGEDKDKEKEEVQVKEKSLYVDFLQKFNQLTNRKFRVLDGKTKRQLNTRLKEGFTVEEILTATKNCKNDEYHIKNPKYLTPEFITRTDKLQKYLNETGQERRFDQKFRTTQEREQFIGDRVKEIRY